MAREPLLITSLQNPRVKDAAKLRDAKARARQGRIVIDGVREIERALAAGVEPLEAFVCPELCQSSDRQSMLARLESEARQVYHVSATVFAKVAFGERAEGAVLVARRPRRMLDDVRLSETSLVAVLEGIEKPGNIGAVARSADGAGISVLLVVGSDPYAPQSIRASLGTIFSMPVCEATSQEARDWLTRHGVRIFAAIVEGAVDYTEADYRGPAAFVLGSEAWGLSQEWRKGDFQAIRISMNGVADSLNVSAAAAVLFYEAARQRSKSGQD